MRRWRWLGFGGSALVAAAAYVVGANVGPVPAGRVALSAQPMHLLGLAGWLVGAAALVVSWLAIARAAPCATDLLVRPIPLGELLDELAKGATR